MIVQPVYYVRLGGKQTLILTSKCMPRGRVKVSHHSPAPLNIANIQSSGTLLELNKFPWQARGQIVVKKYGQYHMIINIVSCTHYCTRIRHPYTQYHTNQVPIYTVTHEAGTHIHSNTRIRILQRHGSKVMTVCLQMIHEMLSLILISTA